MQLAQFNRMMNRVAEFAKTLPNMSDADLLAAHDAVRRDVQMFCDAESRHPDRGIIKTKKLAIENQLRHRRLI